MEIKYNEPDVCGLSTNQIAALAERFAKEISYSPEDDLDGTLARFGGEISYVDLWELKKSDSGSIRVEPDGKFRITLPNHTSPQRDRFTVGHELGHFVLHFLLPRSTGKLPADVGLEAHRYGSGPIEYEANRFAAAFLMPANDFITAYEESGGNLEEIAQRYAVSLSAAAVRSKALGLG